MALSLFEALVHFLMCAKELRKEIYHQVNVLEKYKMACNTFISGGGHFNPLLKLLLDIAVSNINALQAKLGT